MKFKFIFISFFYLITANSQTEESNNSENKGYNSATANTLFEDDPNATSKNKKTNYIPKAIREDLYQKNQLSLASTHISKMQYSEAAKLYEAMLASDVDTASVELLQLIGDAHFYNSDIEKSFLWYDKLYEKDKDFMSANDLIKYAQTLKKVGKYNKAIHINILAKRKEKQNEKLNVANHSTTAKPSITVETKTSNKQEFKIKNLAINTSYSDVSPGFFEGNKLIFSSTEKRRLFQDLFVVNLTDDSSHINSPEKISKIINSRDHETATTFSLDRSVMYFTRSTTIKSYTGNTKNLKIYKSVKIGENWSQPKAVSFASDDYSTGHPSLSTDGKKLYFASNMPGSIGETDIFVVDILEDGTFSSPKNLGPQINTTKNELYPYATSEKLYFSSNGRDGFGGLDIYEAAINNEIILGVAKNLGVPFNGADDDFSFIINENSKKGFFASDRPGGKGEDDIYSFTPIE